MLINVYNLGYQIEWYFFRSSNMGSKNELLDDLQDELIPKIEPIDVDSIKKEKIDEELFVAPGILEPLEVYKYSVKEETIVNEGIEPCLGSLGAEDEEEEPYSSSNVRLSLQQFKVLV